MLTFGITINNNKSRKNVPTYFFALCWSNMNRFQNKLVDMFCKNTYKVSTSPKICASTTLPWEIWGNRLSRQRSTYMYILMNRWIATKTTGSYCLKNHQTCSNKSRHLYTICFKYLPPARTQARRRWCHVANRTFNEQRDSNCSLILMRLLWCVEISDLSTRWRRTFRACSVKTM